MLAINFIRFRKLYKQFIYEGLGKCYSELGDYKQALAYFTLSKEAEEETYHEQYQNLFMMLEADSEDEKTEKQLALLASDNELKEMKNEHQTVLLGQKLLRSQINPHFIFNSLANIQEFIWNRDLLTANEYLSSFSKLVRLILENSRNDFVTVEKEISTIDNYLNLQKLRYREKLEFNIDVDPEIDEEDMLIPPMLVQPFIENSIEHGISQKETTGHVHVRFILEGNHINNEVKDDGIGFMRRAQPGDRSAGVVRDSISAGVGEASSGAICLQNPFSQTSHSNLCPEIFRGQKLRILNPSI